MTRLQVMVCFYNLLSDNERLRFRLVHTAIGPFRVSNWAERISETEEFKRLRNISQLGPVFVKKNPSIKYSRETHSWGVYKLCLRLWESITRSTPKDELLQNLRLSPYVCDILSSDLTFRQKLLVIGELVCIAGLLHDIGHGPFSHFLEQISRKFWKDVGGGNPPPSHESRSVAIIKLMKSNCRLPSYLSFCSDFICSIISPKENEKDFLHQIICNNLNGVDVDKFDYIIRDMNVLRLPPPRLLDIVDSATLINGIICFSDSLVDDVGDVFRARGYLFRNLYYCDDIFNISAIILSLFRNLRREAIYDKLFSTNSFLSLSEESVIAILCDIKNYRILTPRTEEMIRMLNRSELFPNSNYVVTKEKPDTSNIDNREDLSVWVGEVSCTNKTTDSLDNIYFYNDKREILKKSLCRENMPDPLFIVGTYWL